MHVAISSCACSQHLLNPRACYGYLASDDAAANNDPEVVALLRQRLALQQQHSVEADISALQQQPGGSSSQVFSVAGAEQLAPHGGSVSTPAAPKGKLRKAWLHEAFDVASGICRFCGRCITSPNTSIKKKHLLNLRTCW